jgi:predicted lipid-binding transport protein (Tim44 family)
MWGSWFGVTFAGLLLLAAFVGLIFGTSIAVFGILIALGLAAAIAVGFAAMRASERSGEAPSDAVAGAQPRNPRSGGAPATGEDTPQAEAAPAPHEPAGTP